MRPRTFGAHTYKHLALAARSHRASIAPPNKNRVTPRCFRLKTPGFGMPRPLEGICGAHPRARRLTIHACVELARGLCVEYLFVGGSITQIMHFLGASA